jgi:hypothetical protein
MRLRSGLGTALAGGVLLAGGCGGSLRPHRTTGAISVIKAWSSALRRGDVNGAAAYFALPSVFVNGSGPSPVIRIHNLAQARLVNETLPCGAKFISAARAGRYVNALFALTSRPGPGGSDCGSGAGQTARVNFVISHGKIVAWIRAADAASPAPPPPAPPPVTSTNGPRV